MTAITSRDHEEHRVYLDFYEEMGIPEAFYWFTLEAASADEVHWMSLPNSGSTSVESARRRGVTGPIFPSSRSLPPDLAPAARVRSWIHVHRHPPACPDRS